VLNDVERNLIQGIIDESLKKAEEHWENGGHKLAVNDSRSFAEDMVTKSESEPSKIPGHSIVQEDETVIAEFIALVADMRDSSKHLLNAISKRVTDISELQRVYYETSALLPALAQTIKFEGGCVTEYLGDGVLALFKVDENDKTKMMYAAHHAAKNIVKDTRALVNNALKERYNLPPVDLGVGLAMSQTLVTLVGLEGEKQPTAFGRCVFKATKLSGGRNEVVADEYLNKSWPTSKGGKLRFTGTKVRGENGFLME
jgi:hypothetical protein